MVIVFTLVPARLEYIELLFVTRDRGRVRLGYISLGFVTLG